MGTFEEINSEWEDGSEEIVQNVTQRQRNGNMSDAKRDKSTSGWHLQSGRTLTPCTFWRVRWWARGHLRQCITWIYREEPEWGGILQNKDPAILNRRKITSEEGLRCRNEWPTTKATKVTSVDEALTKLLGENSECVGFVMFNAADGSDFLVWVISGGLTDKSSVTRTGGHFWLALAQIWGHRTVPGRSFLWEPPGYRALCSPQPPAPGHALRRIWVPSAVLPSAGPLCVQFQLV